MTDLPDRPIILRPGEGPAIDLGNFQIHAFRDDRLLRRAERRILDGSSGRRRGVTIGASGGPAVALYTDPGMAAIFHLPMQLDARGASALK